MSSSDETVRDGHEFDNGHPTGAMNIPAFFSTAMGMQVNPDFVSQASFSSSPVRSNAMPELRCIALSHRWCLCMWYDNRLSGGIVSDIVHIVFLALGTGAMGMLPPPPPPLLW